MGRKSVEGTEDLLEIRKMRTWNGEILEREAGTRWKTVETGASSFQAVVSTYIKVMYLLSVGGQSGIECVAPNF